MTKIVEKVKKAKENQLSNELKHKTPLMCWDVFMMNQISLREKLKKSCKKRTSF